MFISHMEAIVVGIVTMPEQVVVTGIRMVVEVMLMELEKNIITLKKSQDTSIKTETSTFINMITQKMLTKETMISLKTIRLILRRIKVVKKI